MSVVKALASLCAGAKGAKAATMRQDVKRRCQSTADTFVDACKCFKWAEQEHEDDADAEYLDSATGHVQHDCLHRELFHRGTGEVPCSLCFELFVSGCLSRG